MSSQNEFENLAGYENLKEAVESALRRAAQDEPPYMFETDVDVDISDWAGDHNKNPKSPYAWSNHEMLEALIGGHYFSATERMEENWFSDGSYDRDHDWYKEKAQEILGDDLSDELAAFADEHGVDEDEVKEALIDHLLDEQSLDGDGLHYNVYRFIGSAAVQVDLGVCLTLEPNHDQVYALARLGISANDWLAAIEHSLESDPLDEGDEEAMANLFNVDDLDDFRESFNKAMLRAAAENIFLPAISDESILKPKEIEKLIDLLRGEWDGYSGNLTLIMKLDENHINDVSLAINRSVDEQSEVAKKIIKISGAILVPDDGKDCVDGLEMSGSIECPIGDFRIPNPRYIDAPDVNTELSGAFGLQTSIYERLMMLEAHMPHRQQLPIVQAAVSVPPKNDDAIDKHQQALDHLAKPPVAAYFEELLGKSSRYELEQCAPKFPGLHGLFTRAIEERKINSSTEAMGGRLLDILRRNGDEKTEDWLVNAEREEVMWLLDHGADVHARLPMPNPQQKGPSALHMAAAMADFELCEKLVAGSADPLATFHLPGDDASSKQGLWEIIARNALANDEGSSSEARALLLRNMAHWAESLGSAPQDFEQHTSRGFRVDVWRCLVALNDPVLTRNHIDRAHTMMGGQAQAIDEHLRRALHSSMCHVCPSVVFPLLDAGVRADAPSPDHKGLSIREAASNYNNHATIKSSARQAGWDAISRYIESKNAMDLIKNIAKQARQTAPTP